MKGFAGIIIAFALLMAAGLLLGINTPIQHQSYSKEIIPELKNKITEYTLAVNGAAQGCDWSLPGSAKNCIDTNSAAALLRINQANSWINCINPAGQSSQIDQNTYKIQLDCNATLQGVHENILIRTSKNVAILKR